MKRNHSLLWTIGCLLAAACWLDACSCQESNGAQDGEVNDGTPEGEADAQAEAEPRDDVEPWTEVDVEMQPDTPADLDSDAQDAPPDDDARCMDGDGDGYGEHCPAGPDCDDSNIRVHPGRDEIPFNGIDDDCDPSTPDTQVFDLDLIRDQTTAHCTLTNPRQDLSGLTRVDVWDISYMSWESIDGELSPILIRGYITKPAGLSSNIPGVVLAHGLGGFAREDAAVSLAALLNMAVLYYTGPGGAPPAGEEGAASEGLPAGHDNYYRLFDTVTDLRGSWFWGHAAAAMRALTCLQAQAPVVDPNRLGITGFSAGGVITLITSGVDDRVSAGVALSGTGAWEVAAESPNAWQLGLLEMAGLTASSPEWTELIDHMITPAVMVGSTPAARLMMVDGTADEFFPLTAFMATYGAVPTEKRMALAGNFDHGCFQITPFESPSAVEERASLRSGGGQRLWFRHFFATDGVYDYVPAPPAVPALVPSSDAATCLAVCGIGAPCLYVTGTVDPGGSRLEVEDASFWWSNDGLFWAHGNMEYNSGESLAYGCFNVPYDPNATAYFVDAQYVTPILVRPIQERFSISSEVTMPAGFVPSIRHSDCSLP
jgi:dienelactone hydrolase